MSVLAEPAEADGTGRREAALSPGRLAVLVLACTLAMLPAFAWNAMVGSHDIHHHMRWQFHFGELLWGGLGYPRWLPEVNEGFGSPVFFIYPPLAHYVGALFRPLFGGTEGIALRVALSAWTALVLGGFGVAVWLRERGASRDARLLAALAYVLAPYHLYADTYLRGALAELWAFAPLPFLLAGIAIQTRRPWHGFVVTTIAAAALVVSHAPSLLIALPAAVLYALLLAAVERRWLILPRTACAFALAFALAGPYLATALTQGSLIASWNLFEDYFRPSRWLLGSPEAWPSPDVGVPIATVAAVQVAVALVLLLRLRAMGWRGADRIFALLLLAGTVILTTRLGRPFWLLDTPLNRIQFPWRLLMLQAIPLAVLTAEASRTLAARRALLPVAAVLALALSNVALGDRVVAWRTAPVETFDWFSYWEPPEYILGDPWPLSNVFADGARALAVKGAATAVVESWRSREVRLVVNAAGPATLALRQFSYSGWRYRIDGGPEREAGVWSGERPVPTFAVPAGRHEVDLWMPARAAERAGWISFGLAVLFLCGLALARRRRGRGRALVARGVRWEEA